MAEQQTHYDFAEVKAADVLAAHEASWHGFTSFVAISTGAIAAVLVLMYLFLG